MPLSQQSIVGSFSRDSRKRPRNSFSTSSYWKQETATRRRPAQDQSRFGVCPICETSFPWHKLETHAASCTGKKEVCPTRNDEIKMKGNTHTENYNIEAKKTAASNGPLQRYNPQPFSQETAQTKETCFVLLKSNASSFATATIHSVHDLDAPPGLFLYPDFITKEEEDVLIQMLDNPSAVPPWKSSSFNGQSVGKRWGVHCTLRDRKVSAPEHELPAALKDIVLSKLSQLDCWKRASIVAPFRPNEANAIDYRRQKGDWLHAHVDDRQLSKEPIANLSLAGTCRMTFTDTKTLSTDPSRCSFQVTLPPRCLQLLTGPARYNYSHGIAPTDLLSDRRISITMRESPLTIQTDHQFKKANERLPKIDRIFCKSKDVKK